MNTNKPCGAHQRLCIPANDILTPLERSQDQEIKLMRKGRGRIIYISDFVEEEFGQLVVRNEGGEILRDARCITYPGASGDPWWDHTQLLAQMDKAISIFEELHPGCATLFIFDQSSAHVSQSDHRVVVEVVELRVVRSSGCLSCTRTSRGFGDLGVMCAVTCLSGYFGVT